MEIRSLYKSLLNRLWGSGQKTRSLTEEKKDLPGAVQFDRREFSSLAAAIQKAERLEEQSEPAELARLKKLEEDISSGAYEVNLRNLAGAMLRSAEERSDQRGEDQ